MPHRTLGVLIAIVALLACHPCAFAQAGERPGASTLRIGTKVSEPFVVRNEDGTLGGLSVELLDAIAGLGGFEYQLIERELDDALDDVVSGELDAAIAAISVTPEREQRLDFSHAYYMSGLGIAVRADSGSGGLLRGLRGLMTPGFWLAVGSLSLVLLLVGIAAWLAERHRNPEEFGGGVLGGIGNGFWFSAVTMTTVGYGDKSPRTLPGRFLALIWMFASIIVISTFTGTIASSITAASLESRVSGPDDLPRARVGTLEGTASQTTLRARGVTPRAYETVEAGFEALARDEIDAFVHDAPILQYAASRSHAGVVRVLEAQFDLRPYAIALPPGSDRSEPFNRALLRVIEGAEWKASVERWIGG
ncbi:MAG: transporter substrate-binding domain-containing protein [Planctomycetota bacterium]